MAGAVVDPYTILAGGELEDAVGRGLPTYKTWTDEAGIGALTALGPQTGSFRLQLRTEAKYRREFIQNIPYNSKQSPATIFGIRVQLEFGAPVPPLDSDLDRVPDTSTNVPNTAGDRFDLLGCTIKDEIKLQGANFATDSADLVPESAFVLKYAVDTLNKDPQMVIEVRGQTDNRGSAKHNLELNETKPVMR